MELGGISIWQIIILIIPFFFVIAPCLLALFSSKEKGIHKLIWFLLSFFMSWIGYALYFFTVIKEQKSKTP